MGKSNPLERAFRVLDIVASANREMSLIEIVNASKLPQSSAFRLASNLVESGMLKFERINKTYSVGPRTTRLSLFVTGQQKLRDILQPTLGALAQATEETSYFVSASDTGNKLVDFVVPEIGANIFIHPGFEFPVHATAAGKVIHAFSENETDVNELGELKAYQPATITDAAKLRDVFQAVREAGYAVNDSELDADVFSICVPVMLKDNLAGAIGVVGPRSRIFNNGDSRVSFMIAQLQTAARDLEELFVMR